MKNPFLIFSYLILMSPITFIKAEDIRKFLFQQEISTNCEFSEVDPLNCFSVSFAYISI